MLDVQVVIGGSLEDHRAYRVRGADAKGSVWVKPVLDDDGEFCVDLGELTRASKVIDTHTEARD